MRFRSLWTRNIRPGLLVVSRAGVSFSQLKRLSRKRDTAYRLLDGLVEVFDKLQGFSLWAAIAHIGLMRLFFVIQV